jgi:hypothetical protein
MSTLARLAVGDERERSLEPALLCGRNVREDSLEVSYLGVKSCIRVVRTRRDKPLRRMTIEYRAKELYYSSLIASALVWFPRAAENPDDHSGPSSMNARIASEKYTYQWQSSSDLAGKLRRSASANRSNTGIMRRGTFPGNLTTVRAQTV